MKKYFFITVLVSLSVGLTSSTDNHSYDTQLSNYVNKIIRLIDWKDDLEHDYFTIGYIGDHHLSKLTDKSFYGKTYHNKPIKVVNYHTIEQLTANPPRLLYIGKHKKHHVDDIAAICEEKHIFSISDDQVERDEVPLILLHIHDDQVDMIVNKTEAERQLFKLSYHLLRAAKEIK